MWKTLLVFGKNFIYKITFENDECLFVISDYIQLWQDRSRFEDIKIKFEELNSGIEIDDVQLKSILKDALDNKNKESNFEMESGDLLKLKITFTISDVKLMWDFSSVLLPQTEFFKVITEPILNLTSNLLLQRASLIKLVKQKEKEIDKYELQELKSNKKSEGKKFSEEVFDAHIVNSKEYENEITNNYANVCESMGCMLMKQACERVQHLRAIDIAKNNNNNDDDDDGNNLKKKGVTTQMQTMTNVKIKHDNNDNDDDDGDGGAEDDEESELKRRRFIESKEGTRHRKTKRKTIKF